MHIYKERYKTGSTLACVIESESVYEMTLPVIVS